MIVKVAGFGKAFRIDLEDVLVRADVIYQTMQSAYIMSQSFPAEADQGEMYNQLI